MNFNGINIQIQYLNNGPERTIRAMNKLKLLLKNELLLSFIGIVFFVLLLVIMKHS